MAFGTIWLIVTLFRLRCRIRNRHYFTKKNLPLLEHSAWQTIWTEQDDYAFQTATGFHVEGFKFIVQLLQRYNWENNNPLFNGSRKGRKNLLTIPAQLGLTLQYLHTEMTQQTLCQLFSVSPGTVSTIIKKNLKALSEVLSRCEEARIGWPTESEMEEFASRIKERHPNLPGRVFGFMDGVFFNCDRHPDEEIQKKFYNGWKSGHTINNVLCFTPDGCICLASLNYPGSTHDSRVAAPIYEELETNTTSDFLLLADSAFQFQHWRILTPFKKNQLDPNNRLNLRHQLLLHRRIVKARQPAEWGMRLLQSNFPRLKLPFSASDFAGNFRLLQVCCRLSNLRTRLGVPGNQIRTVHSDDYVRNIFANYKSTLRRFYHRPT